MDVGQRQPSLISSAGRMFSSSTMNVAPFPGPGLSAVMCPPISRTAFAQ